MAGNSEGFNQFMTNMKARKEKSRELDLEIRTKCLEAAARYRAFAASIASGTDVSTPAQLPSDIDGSILTQHSPNGTDVSEPAPHIAGGTRTSTAQHDEQFSFKPSIYLDARKKINVERAVELNKLFKQGEEKGARMLRALNNRPTIMGVGEVDEKRRALNRCAVYALIKEETDKIAVARGLIEPDPRYPPDVVEILEEVFAQNETPNEPEIAYLGQATGLGQRGVIHWFEEKRERLKPVRLAKAAIPMEGPAGKLIKKMMLAKRNAERNASASANANANNLAEN